MLRAGLLLRRLTAGHPGGRPSTYRLAAMKPGLPVSGVAPLGRRLLAELVGTGLLVTVVVGSGIAGRRLSPDDVGLQLFYNSTATVFELGTLILLVGPVSGAHLNPVVSAADWLLGRRSAAGLPGPDLGMYAGVQTIGAYIGAAYWFTSSTSFANPAVTVGRMFSDTFAGHRTRLRAGVRPRAARRWRPRPRSRPCAVPRRRRGVRDDVVVPHSGASSDNREGQ